VDLVTTMTRHFETPPLKILASARLITIAIVAASLGVVAGPTTLPREAEMATAPLQAASSEPVTNAAPSNVDRSIRSGDLNNPIAEASDGKRPSFDVLSIDTTGNTIIAGRSTPNDVLELRVDGEIVAQAKADRLGSFEVSPPPLKSGSHRIELANPSHVSARVQIEVPKASNDELSATDSKVATGNTEQIADIEAPIIADNVPLPPQFDRTRAHMKAGTTHLVHSPSRVKPSARKSLLSQASPSFQPTMRQMDGARGTASN
jgi:hypothetical protein